MKQKSNNKTRLYLLFGLFFLVIVALLFYLKTNTPKSTYETTTVTHTTPFEAPIEPVTSARSHLAGMLEIPIEEVIIISQEPVVWDDTCLGLPKHSRCGVKGPVPGYKLILEANGKKYYYHTGGYFYADAKPNQY